MFGYFDLKENRPKKSEFFTEKYKKPSVDELMKSYLIVLKYRHPKDASYFDLEMESSIKKYGKPLGVSDFYKRFNKFIFKPKITTSQPEYKAPEIKTRSVQSNPIYDYVYKNSKGRIIGVIGGEEHDLMFHFDDNTNQLKHVAGRARTMTEITGGSGSGSSMGDLGLTSGVSSMGGSGGGSREESSMGGASIKEMPRDVAHPKRLFNAYFVIAMYHSSADKPQPTKERHIINTYNRFTEQLEKLYQDQKANRAGFELYTGSLKSEFFFSEMSRIVGQYMDAMYAI